ncbi:MAG TPA: aminopeptidase P family protein [Cryptosporangiaceae bacterium]|nr:aminopeptidase P family protein [Cryptosporangiaceae bacterium]
MNEQPIRTASHDLPISEQLAAFMRTGWAEPDRGDLGPLPHAPFTAARRERLAGRFPGETLVVPTGTLKVRNNDCDYEFRPGSDFAWLTGFYEHDAVLVLRPRGGGEETTLYLRARSSRQTDEFFRSRDGELWTGRRRSADEWSALLGLHCAPLEELEKALGTLDPATTRVLRGVDASVDAAVPAQDAGVAAESGARADGAVGSEAGEEPVLSEPSDPVAAQPQNASRDDELAAALSELRLVKDAWEVEQLVAAVQATVRGFEDVVRAMPPDRESAERLVDGVFGLRARHDGNTVGYGTIAAAGEHACTLHHWRNDGVCRPGELLLLDAGVENPHYYTADVTRTLPVGGRFTDVQRRVYELVRAAQEAGVATVRPGVAWRDIHRACMRVIAHGLAEWGLLPVSAEESLDDDCGLHRRWTLHASGHMLGLDVHDCAKARAETYLDGTLAVGHVLTVEPGLYFQPDDETVPAEYRGIGVRIEDDVLVTETGCVNLSAALPRRADEVESWMADLRAAGPRLPG